jgi:hypothetical protein
MLLEAKERDQGAQSQLELSHVQSAGASSRKVIAPARSPMTTQGAMVLPVTMRGMIDPSARSAAF